MSAPLIKRFAEAKEKKYTYWKNKPVSKLGDKVHTSDVIDKQPESQFITKYKKDQYTELVSGYSWEKIELGDTERMNVVGTFLTKNYMNNMKSQFIITYDAEFLRWKLNQSGYFLAVLDQSKNMCGLIGYSFKNLQIADNQKLICEPVFMCVDPKYRTKGVSKVLMDETIRQSLMMGVNSGFFCTDRIVPSPIGTLRHYSRPLNYKLLLENKFMEIDNVNIDVAHERSKIKLAPNPNYRLAQKTPENIQLVHDFYTEQMKTYSLHMIMSLKDIENYFFDERYVRTYLVYEIAESSHSSKNKGKKKTVDTTVTTVPVDFVSYNFYDVLNNTNNNIIKASNILMYTSLKTRSDLIIINILKQISFDKCHVVYMSDMMQNSDVLLSNLKTSDQDTDDEEENAIYDLNFLKTGKKTFINLFNWKCAQLTQNMICIPL